MRRLLAAGLVALTFAACSGKEEANNDQPNNVNVQPNNDNVQPNNENNQSNQTGCGSLAEGDTQCSGADQEVCQRGLLVTRACPEGRGCAQPDAQCECNLEDDGLCPDGCATDPDCADCTPDCAGKTCGSDSCGGVCGMCDAGTEVCDEGACIDVTGVCGNDCGPEGDPGLWADDGECDDGGDGDDQFCEYGTDCGDCGPREPLPVRCTINYNGDCPADQRCNCDENTGDCICGEGARGSGAFGSACAAQHDCESGLCLDDICSRGCDSGGDCAEPIAECQAILGLCVAGTCTPDCTGKVCGDDGCGGDCGTCPGGEVCSSGQCVTGGASDIECPYLVNGACAVGESCCVTQSNQSACFPLGGNKDALCLQFADAYAYLYIGCLDDADCPGQECCGDTHKTFCADTCQTSACTLGTPGSCEVGESCCPHQPTTGFFTTDPRNTGYCFPGSCP